MCSGIPRGISGEDHLDQNGVVMVARYLERGILTDVCGEDHLFPANMRPRYSK